MGDKNMGSGIKSEKEQKTAYEKGVEDCKKRYPPREEDPDYVEGYAEEYRATIKAMMTGGART